MAGIDKTYTDNYKDYKEFKDWADKQVVTFFDGSQKCIGDSVWDYEPEDFNNGEIPIMNTPIWLDSYLLQNCKVKFVLDRMNEVYGEEHIEKMVKSDFLKPFPPNYKQNRKIVITTCSMTKFPLHSKPYKKGRSKYWWLQCVDNFWYSEETKVWVDKQTPYPTNTNTSRCTSIKAIVRHLRKQYLPKGVTFRIMGNYVGEIYIAKVL